MQFDEARAAVRRGEEPSDLASLVVGAMTPEERLWCLDGDAPTWAGLAFLARDGYHLAAFAAAEVERLGMPGFRFADGPRGCALGNATAFPVSMARGATWDPDLEERVGAAIGAELRAAGADLTGAVCINLLRHPAWGRAQETYGEDPHHVGELGAALTRGLQRHVMACVKHFACNSMENARFSVDIEVDEVALHEVYLPHFRRVIDEGAAAVMTAYNSVNGEWCGQNAELITGVLRDEWGFEGFVISDWIFGMRDAARSVTAGLDVEMPYRMVRATHLTEALDRGEVSWADVDAAVERIVATLLRFDEVLSATPPSPEVIGGAAHRALAREVAARSVVLLRNEPVEGAPVLPLAPGTRLAVLGRLAAEVNLGDGGSSDVWDLESRPLLEGLTAAFDPVTYEPGDDLARAAAVAAEAEVALVVVGTTYLDEGEYIGATDPALVQLFPEADEPEVVKRWERTLAALRPVERPAHLGDRQRGFSIGGDRRSLDLSEDQVALIGAVAAANPRTVVVLQGGSAFTVESWVHDVAAVVHAFYGGCEAGAGLADVLTGAVDASGRLPFSVPRSAEDLPPFEIDAISFRYDRWHGWWHLARVGAEPRFPFGFGRSYTSFELTAAEVTTDPIAGDLVVTAEVRNTGSRPGAEVVQVYATLPDTSAPPRLVGFARVEIAAGSVASLTVRIPPDRLATRDPDQHVWRPPAGEYLLRVARFAGDPDGIALEAMC